MLKNFVDGSLTQDWTPLGYTKALNMDTWGLNMFWFWQLLQNTYRHNA